jgi:hypothetical protein
MKPAFDARVIAPQNGFQRNVVTLAIRDNDQDAYLMPDGTWLHVDEGTYPERMGIDLPAAAIEAIALAVQEWQGHTSHADTEARVLREWLSAERARVDKVLDRP